MADQTSLDRRGFIKLLSGIGAGTLLGCSRPASPRSSLTEAPVGSVENLIGPLRLHSNESPYGPFPQALPAISAAAESANRYTDAARKDLIATIARHHGLKPDQVLLGCGSIELLKIVTDAFSSPAAVPVIAEPVYEAIDYYASLRDIHPIKVPLTSAFTQDLPRMADVARRNKGMVYLCNPANPTGTIVDKHELENFIHVTATRLPLVIDEAYAEYVDSNSYESSVRFVQEGRRNVVVLRTFSKIYGLAGMRIGYALGSRDLLQRLAPHRLWNNINQAGAAAALVSFGDKKRIEWIRRQNNFVKQLFYEKADKLGIAYIPSQASFVMLHTNHSSTDIIERFKKQGILIGRPIPSMPESIRITLGTQEEMRYFFEKLAVAL